MKAAFYLLIALFPAHLLGDVAELPDFYFWKDSFVETGELFDQETAQRLRTEILSRGGTRPGMELYVNFRGREPSIQALLEARGLTGQG